MDATPYMFMCAAALGGWLLAMPLQALADRLLAAVPAEDATPAVAVVGVAGDVMAHQPQLALAISPRWRWALRIGLALIMPLAVRRALAPASIFLPRHLPPLVDIALLGLCVAALCLSAVLDGATHLVFAEVVGPPALVLAVVGLLEGQTVWLPMLLGGIIGGGIFLLLYFAGRFWYGTDALGFGDVQLAAAFGILLGWPVVLSALVLGLILMVLTVLPLLALRRMTTRAYLPIGAFLALGALVGLLLVPPPWL